MIAFTRPFTCHVDRGLVAMVAIADGTSASSATVAPSAAIRIRAPKLLPTPHRGYGRPRPGATAYAGGGDCQSYVPGGVHDSSSLMPSGSKKKIAW